MPHRQPSSGHMPGFPDRGGDRMAPLPPRKGIEPVAWVTLLVVLVLAALALAFLSGWV